MATHNSIKSLIRESLKEYLEVSFYCINYRKNPKDWGSTGCLGYPAAVLLFSIADSIGSYIIGGSTKDHFNILNYSDYYNLDLSDEELEKIYKEHRCLLTHNAALNHEIGLSLGQNTNNVIEYRDKIMYLNLFPFYKLSKSIVYNFLDNLENIELNNITLNKIFKQSV